MLIAWRRQRPEYITKPFSSLPDTARLRFPALWCEVWSRDWVLANRILVEMILAPVRSDMLTLATHNATWDVHRTSITSPCHFGSHMLKMVGPQDKESQGPFAQSRATPRSGILILYFGWEINLLPHHSSKRDCNLTHMLLLLLLTRNYSQKFTGIVDQSENLERLKLASCIWKWSMPLSFCCGYIISSQESSLAVLSTLTTHIFSCILFLCLTLITVLSIYSLIIFWVFIIIIMVFVVPWTLRCKAAGTSICLVHSYVFST